MCNKIMVILLVGGLFFPEALAIAQESPADTSDSLQGKVSVDSSAVENKFKMYDLGIEVDPTDEEKAEASKQLEQMANQNAKTLAGQERDRAKARIDSLLAAERMQADSAELAQQQGATAQSATDSMTQERTVASDTGTEAPITTDSLVTLAELQQHLNALRTKYQEEITDLRDRNLQLSRKIEYLQGELRRVENSVEQPARNPQTPKSLTAQPPERPIPQSDTHLEKEYLLGVRSYYTSNFGAALGKFQRVVTNATDKQLAANAQYWIGESYYQLGNFSQAIHEMDQYINKFQATKQRKDALVIMGLAHKRMGELEQALQYFEQVVDEYPDSEYARIAKSEVKKLRYLTS